jgi:diguanylate cyclase (GGDEF)-like protein
LARLKGSAQFAVTTTVNRAPVRTSSVRLFATYALISLVPVVLLGLVLAASYRTEAQNRGIAEGRSEAILIARTAIEPVLGPRPLGTEITQRQRADFAQLASRVVHDHQVLRLRLRNLSGNVVWSDDGSGFKTAPEDEALDAAHGTIVARLTTLNGDPDDTGPVGPAAVEAYIPLVGATGHRVGVLEIYLPYAPINADVTAGLASLYRDLSIGLGLLYLVLFGISVAIGRGLRREAARNKVLAEYDTLTGLPNRLLFQSLAAEAVVGARKRNIATVIAIIDLDRFKVVNDTLGHVNGDEVLTVIAGRLRLEMRPGDTVARLGGDEFGVILPAVDAEAVLAHLREVIRAEILVAGLPIAVEASVGYAVAPEHGLDPVELMQRADVAMYLAKGNHAGVTRYDPQHDDYDAAHLALGVELQRAIELGELVLFYQPQGSLLDGRIEAAEALVRWVHPDRGLIYPDEFIPLAEQTDLIFGLTTWLLEQAVSDLADRIPDVAVAVNVSARSLANEDFVEQVAACLARHDVEPSRLIVEVTETALISDPARTTQVLHSLTALGVRTSLDDFGCGQTSLAYVAGLPFYELKIDRTFVSDLLTNSGHAAIVRSITNLGHALSFHVLAEGVESQAVATVLAELGCDAQQGYFLAKPMPCETFLEWLSQRERFGALLPAERPRS